MFPLTLSLYLILVHSFASNIFGVKYDQNVSEINTINFTIYTTATCKLVTVKLSRSTKHSTLNETTNEELKMLRPILQRMLGTSNVLLLLVSTTKKVQAANRHPNQTMIIMS